MKERSFLDRNGMTIISLIAILLMIGLLAFVLLQVLDGITESFIDILAYGAAESALEAECAELGYPDYVLTQDWFNNRGLGKFCVKFVDGTSVTIPLEEARAQ